MNLEIIIIIGIIVLAASFEFADTVTYGCFLRESKSDWLSEKLSEKCFTSKGTIHFKSYDFIAKKTGITSRWSIYKNGDCNRIWIGSKMNKLLDDKYKELRSQETIEVID